MTKAPNRIRDEVHRVRARIDALQARARATLVGQVWERMLEIEFVDRSVALAGKAFVSFFPLVIVVAAYLPKAIRNSILSTLTNRLGIRGAALELALESFRSTEDVRRATGLLGLTLTFLFAISFTTALQRIYLRAWRRPAGLRIGTYSRGPAWLVAFLGYMAALGALRGVLAGGPGFLAFLVFALVAAIGWWWFTAWFLLLGDVRARVLLAGATVAGIAQSAYVLSALLWMPNVVTRNNAQFGFFGIALALVTWFSGAAMCILVGACAGPVLAEDPGTMGRLIRGRDPRVLVDGAPPPIPPPTRDLRLRDAFRPTADDELPVDRDPAPGALGDEPQR